MSSKPLPTVVYTPEPVLRHPAAVVREMVADLRASRELAWQLAVRDLRAQYRQAALGFAWAFFMPVANTLVWLFMQGVGVISIRDTGMPYAAFVFTGTMLWAIFMDAITAPLQQTTAAKPLLGKINFPREALVVSGVYQTLFHAAIRLAVLVPALWLLGITPGASLALAPLAVLALIITGTAVGVGLTPVGMLYTDIGRALPLLLQFLMFLTPVVYPVPRGGIAAAILEWNPLTPLIVTGRALLTGQPLHGLGTFVAVTMAGAALLCLAWLAYRIAMPILIERTSA